MRSVGTEQPDGKQPTMELFAWESSSCLCCVHKLGLFFKVWKKKRRRNSVQKERALKDWEQPQLPATTSSTLSTSQQLQNPLTGQAPTPIFVTLWANPSALGGELHRKWQWAPAVTHNTLSHCSHLILGTKGRSSAAAADVNGSVPLWENRFPFGFITSVMPESFQSFLVSVNSDTAELWFLQHTDSCAYSTRPKKTSPLSREGGKYKYKHHFIA